MHLSRTIITFMFVAFACIYYNKYSNDEVKVKYITTHCDTTFIDRDFFSVVATYYNADKAQTDDNPLETADGSIIDTNLLNANKLRWCAISRDLTNVINFGDTITIYSNNSKINGKWVVHDLMNSRFHSYVDFLVSNKDNLNIGKDTIKICKEKKQ